MKIRAEDLKVEVSGLGSRGWVSILKNATWKCAACLKDDLTVAFQQGLKVALTTLFHALHHDVETQDETCVVTGLYHYQETAPP